MKSNKMKFRKGTAILLTIALIAGYLPLQTPIVSRAAEAADYGISKPSTSGGVTTWDCVWFGNYWQEDTNGDGTADEKDEKTPIKWRVLSVNGDNAFLLADQNLDCRPYNATEKDVTWATCTLRSWLNGYGSQANTESIDYTTDNFLKAAFTEQEQSAIHNTDVVNENNPDYNISGGNDTSDKVYLLSIGEAMNSSYGFTSSKEATATRKAVNTAYVKTKGVNTDKSGSKENGFWWLRSPGDTNDRGSSVGGVDGLVYTNATTVNDKGNVVRPVLHLNLSSSEWSYAGTVSSDGTVNEKTALKNPRTDSNGATTWDCVWFGNYWQEDTNGDGTADEKDEKTPIKWRVLSVDGNDAFLLADQNLDCRKYNDTEKNVTWETCTLRSWLNGYGSGSNTEGIDYSTTGNFLNDAFTSGEQSAIKTTTVENNISNRIFLLSTGEATNPSYGFSNSTGDTATRGGVVGK